MTALGASHPPRFSYAGAMLGVTALAVGCAAFVADSVGSGGPHVLAAGGVVAGASLVGLIPAFMGSAERFGVFVLMASVTRLLIVLVAATLLTEIAGHPRRPLWLGVASGAAIALVAESILAVRILASLNRSRLAGAAPAREQESGATC